MAPTDSRIRPDQRLMEDGEWDEANREKVRLEEKQRATRRLREEAAQKVGLVLVIKCVICKVCYYVLDDLKSKKGRVPT